MIAQILIGLVIGVSVVQAETVYIPALNRTAEVERDGNTFIEYDYSKNPIARIFTGTPQTVYQESEVEVIQSCARHSSSDQVICINKYARLKDGRLAVIAAVLEKSQKAQVYSKGDAEPEIVSFDQIAVFESEACPSLHRPGDYFQLRSDTEKRQFTAEDVTRFKTTGSDIARTGRGKHIYRTSETDEIGFPNRLVACLEDGTGVIGLYRKIRIQVPLSPSIMFIKLVEFQPVSLNEPDPNWISIREYGETGKPSLMLWSQLYNIPLRSVGH